MKRGDRVDVLATASTAAFSQDPAAKVVLQDVEILAVRRNPQKEEPKKRSVKREQVVTLSLSLEQTERLALASTEGSLLLALRNRGDHQKTETKGVLLTSLFPNPIPPAPKNEAPNSSAPRPEPVVEIIRGAARTQQILN